MNSYSFTPLPIDPLLYPMMADPYDRHIGGGYYLFEKEKVTGYIQQNPQAVHSDGYLIFPFALAMFDEEKNHILSAVIEQTDYRILSELIKTPLKELVGDMKGHYSPYSLSLYHHDAHEILQDIDSNFTKEEAIDLLIDIACDAFNTPFTPQFVDTSGKSH
jgi:hypothetical protein